MMVSKGWVLVLFAWLSVAEGIKLTLDQVLNLQNNDGGLWPNAPTEKTHVNVTFFVDAISVDEKAQVIEISGKLIQEWKDPNLQINIQVGFLNNVAFSSISGGSTLSKIWRPDLIAAEEVRPTNPHAKLDFMRIRKDGYVIWTQRVRYAFPCQLDLQVYPLGTHKCVLKLQSLGYDNNELQPEWKEDNAIDYNTLTMSHGYILKEVKRTAKSVAPLHITQRQLQMELEIEATGGWAIKHTVIPLIATVTIAYLSFFINIREFPLDRMMDYKFLFTSTGVCARMITCMLSFATAAIFHESTYRNVPMSAQTMAIEVFTGTCLTFIFIATVESVVVDVLAHLPTKGRRSPPSSSFALEPDLTEESSGHKGPVAAMWLDRCFRVLYPASFLAFNAVYWVVYN